MVVPVIYIGVHSNALSWDRTLIHQCKLYFEAVMTPPPCMYTLWRDYLKSGCLGFLFFFLHYSKCSTVVICSFKGCSLYTSCLDTSNNLGRDGEWHGLTAAKLLFLSWIGSMLPAEKLSGYVHTLDPHLRFCCGTIADFIPLVWILSVNVPSDWLLGTAAWQPPYKGPYHSVSIATRLSKSVCELRPGRTWPVPSPSPRHLCTSCCNERLYTLTS